MIGGNKIIAIEEHFADKALYDTYSDRGSSDAGVRKLLDIGPIRLAEMDANGVDMQVISHTSPSTQRLPAKDAVAMTKGVNDRLKAAIAPYPDRMQAFALLPTAVPEAAADELERTVTELGFKGAMINGPSNGKFVDTPEFWPIYARAEKLDVPIYLHPAIPMRAVTEAYYQDYIKEYPGLLSAGWGFTVETATQGIRLILSGVFQKHPKLKIILGHLGETLPFQVHRIDEAISRRNKDLRLREVFRNNFYVTTSGFFSDEATKFTIEAMGIDHVLFAIDWPHVPNEPGSAWFKALDLPAAQKAAIAHGNATRLLRL